MAARPSFPRLPKETYIAGFTIIAIVLHLVLRYGTHAPLRVALAPLIVALLVGGTPLVFDLAKKLVKREFGSDLLAGVSILTAVWLGQYLVAAIVVLMLSGGTALEEFATARASSVLDALARRMPGIAHRRGADGPEDVKLEEIRIGDVLIVLPHEICPVDGVVIEGRGKMDEAYLTGEPYEISKMAGSQVISGAINGDAALVIRAEKLAVGFAIRANHEGDAIHRAAAPASTAAGRSTRGMVHTGGVDSGWDCRAREQRYASLPGGGGGGDAMPSAAGDSHGDYWGDFTGGAAGDHHQESSGPGADRFLPDADLRQDRHADVRTADAYRNHLRRRI